jgi:Uma2 family endonuclease
MAGTQSLVSIEEYLRTSYKPACDYRDGVLTQKPMPTYEHSLLQIHLGRLILPDGGFLATSEQTVRIGENRFLVPDVAVQESKRLQRPYPSDPIFLCIEILSPEDRFGELVSKCQEYLAWGVPMTWIIDPDTRRAWTLSGKFPEEVTARGELTAGPLRVSLAELFGVLDR